MREGKAGDQTPHHLPPHSPSLARAPFLRKAAVRRLGDLRSPEGPACERKARHSVSSRVIKLTYPKRGHQPLVGLVDIITITKDRGGNSGKGSETTALLREGDSWAASGAPA